MFDRGLQLNVFLHLQILQKSVNVRMQKWLDFRRHIAFRCKVTFQYHLSNRGYFGKVIFDHVKQTLDLKVQTNNVNAMQPEGAPAGSLGRDSRALSGGEKSFSTICLLLAMWESIGSPIRCLDEFDVFMDAVNRRMSSKMIVRSLSVRIAVFRIGIGSTDVLAVL